MERVKDGDRASETEGKGNYRRGRGLLERREGSREVRQCDANV